MNIFFEFVLRLIAGMAAAMGLISARQVSGAFYRNHLYVLLGLATLASLVATSLRPALLWETVAVAGLAYGGAIAWLYEAKRIGKLVLWLIGGLSLAIAIQATVASMPGGLDSQLAGWLLHTLDVATASWLLGAVMISMLLGHWYLNAPEMEIAPLRNLMVATYVGLFSRALLCGGILVWSKGGEAGTTPVVFWLLVLRWLFGFVGLGCVLWMAWQTLKIPNTQSATGLLYIAVFAVLAGELISILLSARQGFAV